MFVKVNSEAINLARAQGAWGDDMPEWVRILAKACDAATQREVGERLDRSGGYVSRVLSRTYAGSYEEAEQLVRSRLAADEVLCPIWNEAIPLRACIRNRRRKGSPRTQAHHAYARTCPHCPNNTDIDERGA